MNEKPILFSEEMVKAILDGRKTQTRRIIKRLNGKGSITELLFKTGRFFFRDKNALWNDVEKRYLLDRCPYGREGDRLQLRETWALHQYLDDTAPREVIAENHPHLWYKADGKQFEIDNQGKWRPSIFMPRWASRITLEVVKVRVERVLDISLSDAINEGIGTAAPRGSRQYELGIGTELVEFANLWDKINGKRGYTWESNPWVWVVEFKRVD